MQTILTQLSGMDVKNLLYTEIDHMGSLLIKQKLGEKKETSIQIIEKLMKNCSDSLNGISLPPYDWVTLAEALMHYMLTAMVLPSQRKINIGGVEISIIIPNAKNIYKNLEQILIIQFCKDSDNSVRNLVEKLKAIQPNKQNIWLVSYLPLDIPVPSNNYVISDSMNVNDTVIFPFSQIIQDVEYYIDQINYSGFKIL